MTVIDLRSDTVTRPTPAMIEAMRTARIGDDGLEGDPTVRELEARAAEITGKEAGLFVVSGTMGNLIGMMANVREPGTILLNEIAHILVTEMGGVSLLANLFPKPIGGPGGQIDLDRLREAIVPKLAPGFQKTVLIALENTHNHAGGTVLPEDYMAAVHALAGQYGIPVHVDGARIFNAAAALGVPVAALARHAETVTFCLSKGLGAPIGAVLVGSQAVIDRGRSIRKMLGGTLRQAGILAAAGIVALDTMVDRLADDHANAKRLAEGLHAIEPSLIDPNAVASNILVLDLAASGHSSAEWAETLNKKGLWTRGNDTFRMRFVTHHHVSSADVDVAIAAFAETWAEWR